MKTNDRLDEGLELLRACSREQAPFDLDLEERMMKEFTNANRSWMPRLGKVAAVALLCMTVAGVSVAATGGFDWIFELTGTMEMPNGDTYEFEDGKLLDDDGNVIGTIEVPGGVDPEDGSVDAVNIYVDEATNATD